MPNYRLRNTTGDDLGTIEHPAPNLEPGDVIELGGTSYPDAAELAEARLFLKR